MRNRLRLTENSNSDEHGDFAESPDSESSTPALAFVPELPAPNVLPNTGSPAETLEVPPHVQDSHHPAEPALEIAPRTDQASIRHDYPSLQRQHPDRFIPG